MAVVELFDIAPRQADLSARRISPESPDMPVPPLTRSAEVQRAAEGFCVSDHTLAMVRVVHFFS
jgi:hypothetical protein